MKRISALTATVVSQIAAGEVIERPASVVKELVENAIDAGATSVIVEAVEGGRDRLRVVDNGAGIHPDDLPLAIAAHATSKITSADELHSVATFGFRGEALNSIAGVSELSIQSRPADQPTGARIDVQFGLAQPIRACGCPVGTQIEIVNLFGNVPVRKRFLKAKQTELGHITETLTRLALAHPQVGLRLTHHERQVLDRPAGLTRTETVRRLFGPEVGNALLEVKHGADRMTLTGLIADPSVDRPNAKLQYLFVNGRFIRDRSLLHAINEGYRGLLMTGRSAVAFLFLEIPPEEVDVNVHPTKIEVRFREPSRVFSLVLHAIRSRLLAADLTARLQMTAAQLTSPQAPPPTPKPDLERRSRINEEFALSSAAPIATPSLFEPPLSAAPARLSAVEPRPAPPTAWADDRRPWPTPPAPTPITTPGAKPPLPVAKAPPPVRALQVHRSFLVVETPEGLLIVDQHALHERILYEEFRQRVGQSALEIEQRLIPEPVDLSVVQVGLLLEQRTLLQELGLTLEEFGDRCVLVQSQPRLLQKAPIAEVVRSIAQRLEETGRAPTKDQLLEELLHLMACKAAVKAGDPLTPAEIDALLARRHLVDDSHHCPHGRPTILQFTLKDLEKQFKRIP